MDDQQITPPTNMDTNAKNHLSPHEPPLTGWFSAEHKKVSGISYICRTRDGKEVEITFAFEEGKNVLKDTFKDGVELGELAKDYYVRCVLPYKTDV